MFTAFGRGGRPPRDVFDLVEAEIERLHLDLVRVARDVTIYAPLRTG